MEKIMEIPGGRGSNAKPAGTENPVGWGVKLEKTLRGGGMDIFWNHTMIENFIRSLKAKHRETQQPCHFLLPLVGDIALFRTVPWLA